MERCSDLRQRGQCERSYQRPEHPSEPDDAVLVVGSWHDGEHFELELGARFPLGGGAITRVRETRQPARIDYTLDPDRVSRQMVAAPIVVSGRLWGATTISASRSGSASSRASSPSRS